MAGTRESLESLTCVPKVWKTGFFFSFFLQLTEEEKEKVALAAAKKAERATRKGGGLNPLAVLFLVLAISIGEC